MSLIAKKPCSFGGRRFFIGDEVPAELVACPEVQEQLGVITIVGEELLPAYGNADIPEIVVMIPVEMGTDGENAQVMSVPATPEDIKQVFSIMQMSADEGVRAIVDVTSEHVLILLHAADSRKKIKNVAKERADSLFSAGDDMDESSKDNEPTGTDTEGAGT